ncbi:MAG: conjugal transfer protein TraK [Gammaproteobacteria bacterium]|nr:conjugal transfer protein TraK [Gammaproteobacteria bacterium]
MNKSILFLFALIASQSGWAQAPNIPVIPVVPAAKAKANLPKLITARKQVKPATINPVTTGQENLMARSKIPMEPGVNEIIQVAVGHLNRIVTPYLEPKITTSSPATTEIRDNVLYIGSTEESPLTLFITEKGSEEQALSLTLIPRKIPPREIFLRLKNNSSTQVLHSKRAEKWERSQPYISTIEKLFKNLALGELPSGYRFMQSSVEVHPKCRQTGMKFMFDSGQIVAGHNLIVHIGVIENTSPDPIEFIESTCGNWDVAAVSSFPKIALNPGELTEVYVAKKRHYKKEIKVKRPSLLLGYK